MSYEKQTWDNTTPATPDRMTHIEDGIYDVQNIQLLAVTDTAPATCVTGDKYFNTTSKKIFTATAENTWGETGTDAVKDIFYIVLSEGKIYSYNDTTLVLLVKPKTIETETDIDSYSCNYVNALEQELINCKAIQNGKQYILVTISSNVTMSSDLKFPFDTVSANTSNGKLSLSNSNIVIGSGVSKVKISSMIFNSVLTQNAGHYTWAIIKYNGTDVVTNIMPLTGSFFSNVCPARVQNVNENDIIYLIADCTGNSTARAGHANTYLLVEIVE